MSARAPTFLSFIAVVLTSICFASTAQSKRVALVVGNDDYANVADLQKAVNDARAMGGTLRDLGFEVIAVENLARRDMNRTLQDFASKLSPGDEALFFYAGHGLQIEGRNYLLPTDIPNANPGQEGFVIGEAVAIDHVLDLIRGSGTRVTILVLDACRNNPFPQKGTRSLGGTRGLARMPAPEGAFIMYSAGVGQEALDRLGDDDTNPNSVFTRTLIPLLKSPGLKLTETARRVRQQVQKIAATVPHQQRPAYYDEVTGEFFFTPTTDDEPAAAVTTAPSADETLWAEIKDSEKASDFEFYLSEHPAGRYSSVAKLRLRQLAYLAQPQPTTTCTAAETVVAGEKRCLKPGDTFRDCPDCPEMVVVPAGEFIMGSPAGEEGRQSDEGPQRSVKIAKPFAVGKLEVTRDQFEAFVTATGFRVADDCYIWTGSEWKKQSGSFRKPGFEQNGNHPAVCMSWDDAKAYIAWLSQKSGKSYRLLAEAEWEYAARAGTTTPFSTGATITSDQANFNGNYTYGGSAKGRYRQKTIDVGSFKPNAFGLYDMHGNVWEWVDVCYKDSYQGAPSDGSAVITGDCSHRVLRGGSWNSNPEYLRSANRFRDTPVNRVYNYGFRLARTVTP